MTEDAFDARVAADTSIAVPYVMRSHTAHRTVRRTMDERRIVLTSHSLAETYSVLTRLPGDARLDPSDAARIIEANFGHPALLDHDTAAGLADILASQRIAGGAVYDALVGLAAKQHGLGLVTRDGRARATYEALGVNVEIVADHSRRARDG